MHLKSVETVKQWYKYQQVHFYVWIFKIWYLIGIDIDPKLQAFIRAENFDFEKKQCNICCSFLFAINYVLLVVRAKVLKKHVRTFSVTVFISFHFVDSSVARSDFMKASLSAFCLLMSGSSFFSFILFFRSACMYTKSFSASSSFTTRFCSLFR